MLADHPSHISLRSSVACCAILFLSIAGCAPAHPRAPASGQWEEAIRAFEEAERRSPSPPGGILFVGSSSIRLWKLEESFPGLPVINRGFGGSHISDCVEFAHRIVTPPKPKVVVFYAGDNDIAAGKSAATVLADFQRFLRAVLEALPQARIVFISIKPSPQRWGLFPEMTRANALIRQLTESDLRIQYADTATPMLGFDGKPRPELYAEDGLHLSAEGYRLWAGILQPRLKE